MSEMEMRDDVQAEGIRDEATPQATAVLVADETTELVPIRQDDVTDASDEKEIPAIPARKHGFRYGCYCFVKRVFDILSAGSLFLVASPVVVLLLLVKFLEDFHNPIYVSKRVGKDGREFNFLKIRTMKPNAESEKDMLEQMGLNEMDGPVFKIKDDPRITPVGKFYRRFSLDELLQLLNIVFGSMSVVGPRPPLPREVAEYEEWHKHRLDVKGGLLCIWQIQPNRNDLSFDEWVKLDLEYIEKQSLWTDIKIICKGAWMVVFDHSGT